MITLLAEWETRGEDLQVFEAGERLYLVNENGRVQDCNRFYRVDGE